MISTSKRISLYFTWFATALLFIFAVMINIVFFWEWWSHENRRIQPVVQQTRQIQKKEKQLWVNLDRAVAESKRIVSRFTDSVALPYTNELQEQIMENHFRNIVNLEDERYIYQEAGEEIILSRITPMIDRQRALAWMSLWGLLIFALLSYLISSRLVTYSLANLKILADHVGEIHIDQLHQKIDFKDLPDHDEIKIVANEINEMQDTIQAQVNQVKRFIANVSHEFKTPLMVIQSSLELSTMTKQYDSAITHATQQIHKLQSLLDTLMSLHQPNAHTSTNTESIDIKPIVDNTVYILTQELQKNQDITIEIDPSVSIHYHQSALQIILKNIIQNAIKYTPVDGTIHISAQVNKNKTIISIADSWPWISSQDLEHIREPFWQWDSSRHIDQGFWLGLSIVKSLLDRHWGEITYSKSELGGCLVQIYI